MLNLNFNTTYSKLFEQPRGYNQPVVSASFFLYGAGGPGALVLPGDNQNFRGGGGGGAGMIVSGTINITPDSVYTFTIPNSSSQTDAKGGDSTFNGFDNDTIFPISALAGGGFRPTRQTMLGGNSGTGVYNHPNFTASYSAFASGSGNVVFDPSGPTTTDCGYGAGAGSGQNGGSSFVSSSVNPNQNTQKSGKGGNGVTSSITLWGWEGELPFEYFPSFNAVTNLTIGAAGGGAGDRDQRTLILGQPPVAGEPGIPNGGIAKTFGNPNARGPGAGGGGDTILGITPLTGSNNSGVGGAGAFIIIYPGIPKLQFSGSVETVYDEVNNATAHMVLHNATTNGTGSFIRSSGGPFDNNPNP